MSYAPNGKSMVYTTTIRTIGVLNLGKEGDDVKEQWRVADLNGVRLSRHSSACTLIIIVFL